MKKLLKELHRREVFSTAGLYLGVCWILIEVGSVMLPIFEAPEWILRALIYMAVIGFPVMLVLAWVFNVTDYGIEIQSDQADTDGASLGNRKTDFVVIAVLAVALIISLYLNIGGEKSNLIADPGIVSVLIADVENNTDDPVFERSLELALRIGLEQSPFITVYSRTRARDILESLRPNTILDTSGARLVAEQEGIGLVISVSIRSKGKKFELRLNALNPESGETVFQSSETLNDIASVLDGIEVVAGELRIDLGDTLEPEGPAEKSIVNKLSLRGLRDLSIADERVSAGQYEESLSVYETVNRDEPGFGQALSGWAFALFYLGRQEQAHQVWQQALSSMNQMTARERYRVLGDYQFNFEGDLQAAIQNYLALVERYPADIGACKNLAAAYFSTFQFDKAAEAAGKALDIYPSDKDMRLNYALYAMYAGDFDNAEKQARTLLSKDQDYPLAWLPIAMSSAARGETGQVIEAYDRMAETNAHGASLAHLGLADIAHYSGNFTEAARLARTGIRKWSSDPDSSDPDSSDTDRHMLATGQLILAHAQQQAGEEDAARASLRAALESEPGESEPGISTQAAAALISIDLNDFSTARRIGEQLERQPAVLARAYGKLVLGAAAMAEGRDLLAVDTLRSGLRFADIWILRFYLGRAYLQAGFYAEAMGEFMLCRERQGEATSIFMDNLPTWRYMAMLPYWLGRVRQELGMHDATTAVFYAERYPASSS